MIDLVILHHSAVVPLRFCNNLSAPSLQTLRKNSKDQTHFLQRRRQGTSTATHATNRIKELARTTFNQRTLSDIGSFGGMFDGSFPNLAEPVLVASADGVGTKLKIAFATGIHNTVGADLVNHCVNDILVQGARPLFFLDYIATGKLSSDVVAHVIEGISRGCRENGCVLGGETAEMPASTAKGKTTLPGFIVGVVDKKKIIDGKKIAERRHPCSASSVGLHTNGIRSRGSCF